MERSDQRKARGPGRLFILNHSRLSHNSLISKAYGHQREIINEEKSVSIEEFRSKWLGIPAEKPKMLMEVFEEHNVEVSS